MPDLFPETSGVTVAIDGKLRFYKRGRNGFDRHVRAGGIGISGDAPDSSDDIDYDIKV